MKKTKAANICRKNIITQQAGKHPACIGHKDYDFLLITGIFHIIQESE